MAKTEVVAEDAEVASDDEASRARARDRVETLRLAKQEWLALKVWTKDEDPSKGDRPPTPNLDALQEEHDMPAALKKSTKKAKSTEGGGRARLGVAYVVDGRIMQMKNRPYTLGYLAFEHSPGINGGRMSTADFRAHLVSLGVADPNAPFSPVVLANGKQIEGIVLGSTTVSPVKNAKPEPEPKKSAASIKRAKDLVKAGARPSEAVMQVMAEEKAKTPRARAAAKADKAATKKSSAKTTPAAKREVTPIPKTSSKPRARKAASAK